MVEVEVDIEVCPVWDELAQVDSVQAEEEAMSHVADVVVEVQSVVPFPR